MFKNENFNNDAVNVMTSRSDPETGPLSWPESGLERVPNCPVCESAYRSPLYERLTDRVFFCAPGEWTLYECLDCHSCYLDPRPNMETIHLAYQQYYTHRVIKRPLTAWRRFKQAFVNGYRNRRFGTSFYPAVSLGIFIAWLLPGYREVLDREFRHLPKLMPGARLLDIGFGGGAFLELARDAGWQVTGVDPDPVAVKAARERGLDVHEGGIDGLAGISDCFDVITSRHMIEHVHDPCGVIKDVYRLLKPGGSFWVETPNLDSYGHKRFGSNWLDLDPPRHLVLFNWGVLESILIREGFNVIKRLPCSIAYTNRSAASKAIRDGRDPRKNASPKFSDRFEGLIRRVGVRASYRRSEFITLIAFKPSFGREG